MSWTPEQARAHHEQVVSGELVRKARERRSIADEISRRFGADIRRDALVEQLVQRAAARIEPVDDVESVSLRLRAIRRELVDEARGDADELERATWMNRSDEWPDDLAAMLVETWRRYGAL